MNISSVNLINYLYNITNKGNNLKSFVSINVKQEDSPTNKNKNLFGFVSVSITEGVLKEKYSDNIIKGSSVRTHTGGSKSAPSYIEIDSEKVNSVELPDSYDKLKDSYSYYYHGKKPSDYELIQTAVASGKMEIATDSCASFDAHKAFTVLVQDAAAKKNSWSNTLYSEDGHYTFIPTEDGKYQMHLIDDKGVGASLENISNWMMSGVPNKNIETRYLNYLRTVDPDLFHVAMQIGGQVRLNDIMEDLHEQGIINDKQNYYDLGLLGMMFGKNSDDMRCLINNYKNSGNYLELLDLYQPDGAESLLNLRYKQIKETDGGFVFVN